MKVHVRVVLSQVSDNFISDEASTNHYYLVKLAGLKFGLKSLHVVSTWEQSMIQFVDIS